MLALATGCARQVELSRLQRWADASFELAPNTTMMITGNHKVIRNNIGTASNFMGCWPRGQNNCLAANKHNSTDPDVTAVTVMLIRLPTAVESTEIGRSVRRSDFVFRFFLAAMVILRRVRLHRSLTRTLPCRVDPDLSTPSHARSMKRLSGVVNQTLPIGMVYRFMRSRVP